MQKKARAAAAKVNSVFTTQLLLQIITVLTATVMMKAISVFG